MELQEVEKREVPEESKDECGLMPSILQGSSDSHQPYGNDKFKDLEADLGQDGACGCSHAKEEEIPTNIRGCCFFLELSPPQPYHEGLFISKISNRIIFQF